MIVNFYAPQTVTYDHGTVHHWLAIEDRLGNVVNIQFGEDVEKAHAFALAVLLAVATPERVVDIMPEVK
ncbi:MAG: hypothetical protein ABFE01_23885 [Phycisphaerales bacterium]